ncbi:MAG: hypothetical protein IPL63_12700 [Saprospiraceae bacterium]|nr:hypothetical protein [Saprospiraceae bacterium]
MKKSVDLNNQNEIGDATSINRLILVGNGFDLAHGMKTSYGDFILWYFRKCWEEAKINYKENILNVRTYKNDLISIEYKVNSSSEKEISTTLDSKNDLNSFIRNTHKFSTFKIKCTFHSNLISLLVKSYTNKNWVDIENAYYEELKRILKTIKELVPSTSDTAIKNLELLNRNFETLKMELQNYLLTIRVPDGNSLIRDEMYCVPEEQISGNAQKLELKNTLILNFNYTSTTNKYANKNSILHIHGDLKNEKKPHYFRLWGRTG